MRLRAKRLVWMVPLAILGIVFLIFIGGEIVALLWNAILPPLFGWPQITFWQSLGILVLSRILFGRWGGHSGGYYGSRSRIRERMKERWGSMTPEERKRLRQRIRDRFGFDPPADGTRE